MDYERSPEDRDAIRDVLAMVAQALEIQGFMPDSGMDPRANLELLLENADQQHCLKIALSMLSSLMGMLCGLRAAQTGTTAEAEISNVLAAFREQMS